MDSIALLSVTSVILLLITYIDRLIMIKRLEKIKQNNDNIIYVLKIRNGYSKRLNIYAIIALLLLLSLMFSFLSNLQFKN